VNRITPRYLELQKIGLILAGGRAETCKQRFLQNFALLTLYRENEKPKLSVLILTEDRHVSRKPGLQMLTLMTPTGPVTAIWWRRFRANLIAASLEAFLLPSVRTSGNAVSWATP
jgi:hypothetical protein